MMDYDKFWKMHGFWFNWLGRQVFVSFGRDVNGFYDRPNGKDDRT